MKNSDQLREEEDSSSSGSADAAVSSEYDENDVTNHPVLQKDDEYFGNYWEETRCGDIKIGLITRDSAIYEELGEERMKDIAGYIKFFRNELDEAEDMIEKMTGVPRFPITVNGHMESDYEYEFDEEKEEKEREKILPALRDHYREWVADTLEASKIKSPFSKLPAELRDMIINFTVEDIEHTWEECGEEPLMLSYIIELRKMCWDQLCSGDFKGRIHDLALLARFMFTRWVRLRELMVAKYEVNEETKKEWQLLKNSGELPY